MDYYLCSCDLKSYLFVVQNGTIYLFFFFFFVRHLQLQIVYLNLEIYFNYYGNARPSVAYIARIGGSKPEVKQIFCTHFIRHAFTNCAIPLCIIVSLAYCICARGFKYTFREAIRGQVMSPDLSAQVAVRDLHVVTMT